MRDYLCIEEKCREGIEYNKEFIEENREEIKSFEEDERNGIQRKAKDNKSLIEGRYLLNFNYELEDINAKYSLGEAIHTIEGDFDNALIDLGHIGGKRSWIFKSNLDDISRNFIRDGEKESCKFS